MMPASWSRVVLDTVAVRELEGALAQPGLTPAQVYRLVEGRSPDALFAVSRLTSLPLAARRLEEHLARAARAAPTLNGRDLLALGVPAGPPVGQVLLALRDARLDGRISTLEEEHRWVRRWLDSRRGVLREGPRDPQGGTA
jgi:tRNA nucleotidyltransferase/poly(A) polymerase